MANALAGKARSSETRSPVAYNISSPAEAFRPGKPGISRAWARSASTSPSLKYFGRLCGRRGVASSAAGIVVPHALAEQKQEKLPQGREPPRLGAGSHADLVQGFDIGADLGRSGLAGRCRLTMQKHRKILQIGLVRRQRVARCAPLGGQHFQECLGLAIYRHAVDVISLTDDATQQ